MELSPRGSALPFALKVPLRKQLSPHVLIQIRGLDGCTAELVVGHGGQLGGSDRFELLRSHFPVEIEIAIGEPLGLASDSSLISFRKSVEEDVIPVDRRGDRLRSTGWDRNPGTSSTWHGP